ncbi:MAG TPA: glycosyltransferase family 2 protein [Stellaceae bacterium]|nr:glycosyltransferase family 2 protein [Stellaceae bacterium]
MGIGRILAEINHLVLLGALIVLSGLGAYLWFSIAEYLRRRRSALAEEARLLSLPLPGDHELPDVLVQIPVFNEGEIVARAAAAVGALEWPRERLHIQILDDSTDGSEASSAQAVAMLRARKIDAELIHRNDRAGFKAGALAAGLARNEHPFVAIFDADYVPPVDFLRQALRPLLADSRLALVQARIDFLNGQESLVTRVQQRILDAHYTVEQPVRSWSGLVVQFNGTCGVWRRAAIDDAGGWEGDTLLEDLDLSYRVQLRGWRGLFLRKVAVPGELPNTIEAWQTQQFRWNKGCAEVARKLLPLVWRSEIPTVHKLLSTIQLTAGVLGTAVAVALVTGIADLVDGSGPTLLSTVLVVCAIVPGLGAIITMSLLGQRELRGARIRDEIVRLPESLVMFFYGAVSTLRGVIEAWLGRASEFVRTPKRGGTLGGEAPSDG